MMKRHLNVLGGGVTISLAQDIHGKSLSNVMPGIELPDRERGPSPG
jgi:hypothetical protein